MVGGRRCLDERRAEVLRFVLPSGGHDDRSSDFAVVIVPGFKAGGLVDWLPIPTADFEDEFVHDIYIIARRVGAGRLRFPLCLVTWWPAGSSPQADLDRLPRLPQG